MALVDRLVVVHKPNPKVHGLTTCECITFQVDGALFVQLDTFGSATRQERGKLSQSIQLNREACEQLHKILTEALAAHHG